MTSMSAPRSNRPTRRTGAARTGPAYMSSAYMSSAHMAEKAQRFSLVVGFDLGHGESALCSVEPGPHEEPRALEIQGSVKSFLTAVADDPESGVVIGDDALSYQVQNLQIGFKQLPLTEPKVREPMIKFVRKVVDSLLGQRQIHTRENTLFVVGCPSGWNIETDVPAYEELLRAANLPNVKVIPESRAAFLSTGLRRKDLSGSILIVDIGSSTTDFTFVKDFKEKLIDFGDERLGAYYIEEILLDIFVSRSPDRDIIADQFIGDPTKQRRALIAVRDAKEAYFRNANLYTTRTMDRYYPISRTPPLLLPLPLDQKTMIEALARPIAQLGNRSWYIAFKDALTSARERMEDGKVDLVIMAGGPSRMRFVVEMAEAAFGKGVVHRAEEPELAIARGLAIAGRIDIQTKEFRAAVRALIRSDRIKHVVEENLMGLHEALATVLADKLQQIVLNVIANWKLRQAGMIRLNQLEPTIRHAMTSWLHTRDARMTLTRAIVKWSAAVEQELDANLEQICDRFYLDRAALRLQLTPQGIHSLGADLRPITPDELTRFGYIGSVVVVLLTTIMALLSGGAGVALIASGPIGLMVGAMLGLIASVAGVDYVREHMYSSDLPAWIRNMISLDRVQAALDSRRSEIHHSIKTSLKTTNFEHITSQIEKAIDETLEKKAAEAELLIT
jgi:molecular chaperone DnaK (HSP70)